MEEEVYNDNMMVKDDINSGEARFRSTDSEKQSAPENEKKLSERTQLTEKVLSFELLESSEVSSDQQIPKSRAHFVFGDALTEISGENDATSQTVPSEEKWNDHGQQSEPTTDLYQQEEPLKKDVGFSRKVGLVTAAIGERMPLKATKSDAFLIKTSTKQYVRSLSKSDLMELKKSMVKSDFKPVQDPLSALKLKKNHSFDYHPCHNPLYDHESPTNDFRSFYSKPSFRGCESVIDSEEGDLSRPSVLFPSVRLLVAALLCCCFIALSVSTSNMAVALICMTPCPMNAYSGDLNWKSEQEGVVLAAQNAGSLLMVVTGLWADRVNGKWMVCGSLFLCTVANTALPMMAHESFWYAVAARLAIGAADACLTPAANSLITRWFPQNERAAALGIITGGRQIGTLFILPTAGYLCTRKDILNGWPAIFYLSGLISILVAVFWLPMGADKPSKQHCISRQEQLYIETRIACESIGKRTAPRHVPWRAIAGSPAVWAGIFALVCHEYPLVIMLQFLPNYMRDVLQFTPAKNGIVSAVPIACLFLSKTCSSSLSTWLTKHTAWTKTNICKMFNGIASAGLCLCVLAVPNFDKEHSFMATVALCGAMLFAGLHTPGVQTALVQLAPPFSGVITGLSFFVVAWFGIGNKLLTKLIVQKGTPAEWAKVFYVSGIIAVLPVVVFTIWGSSDRQWWSAPSSKVSVHSLNTQTTIASN